MDDRLERFLTQWYYTNLKCILLLDTKVENEIFRYLEEKNGRPFAPCLGGPEFDNPPIQTKYFKLAVAAHLSHVT